MNTTFKLLMSFALLVNSALAQTADSVRIPPAASEPYTALASVSEARLRLMETLFFVMTNDVRISVNQKPLLKNEGLVAAARSHSQDMAINHFYNHKGPGGDDEQDRVRAAEACGPEHCVLIGETLAITEFKSEQGIFENFKTDPQAEATAKKMIVDLINSPHGHFGVMTDPDLEEMGMGIAMSDDSKLYLTQVFVRRSPMRRKVR